MKARANKSSNKPDSELKEFEMVRQYLRRSTGLKFDQCWLQILKDFKDKGEEELALEETMQKKTAAARKKAATRNQRSEYMRTVISSIGAWT